MHSMIKIVDFLHILLHNYISLLIYVTRQTSCDVEAHMNPYVAIKYRLMIRIMDEKRLAAFKKC